MTFDAAAQGTAVERWTDDERYRALPALDLTDVDRLVVVAAHPDDESLGAGGLITALAASGARVDVVVVTDGSGSHPSSRSHDPAAVAAVRRREAEAAVAILAPDAGVTFLDVPDGMTDRFRERVTEGIARVIGDGPGTLVVAPFRGDGHRDHREVGEATAAIANIVRAAFIEYPIWLWHWGTPDDPAVPWTQLRAHPLSAEQSTAKSAAIASHASQVDGLGPDDGDEPMLRPDFVQHFTTGTEVFVVEEHRLPQAYFDRLYARKDDPWSFATRWYEKRKRAVTLASLTEERYPRALEIGCSIGLLTEQLADRCDALLAVDISARAADIARERVAGRSGVTVLRRDISESFPEGPFDLIMLSEVGYYLDEEALRSVVAAMVAALAPGGAILACHWRHPVTDYPLTGDRVHEIIHESAQLTAVATHVEADFVLEVFSLDGRSVAARTGLV